ncbi:MAG: zinc-dependent alcohol dehydrogenase [Anaerolineae bacterium]
MPRELMVTSPKIIAYFPYEDPEPAGSQVLVRTTVSGIKHGTELNHYRGQVPFENQTWDPTLRLFRPLREHERNAPFFPHSLGSWAAGVVERIGPDITRFRVGDRVHGEWKHRETALMDEGALYPIGNNVEEEIMLFSDPARFALGGIHDADIKLGDRVAVFGLGAIGLLVVQMARLSGAGEVIVVDPDPKRLGLACAFGADAALNPLECDPGVAIKEATHGLGVDVAVEVSGVYSALQQAIRSVHREGLVVTISFYGDQLGRLDLASEWHHNRINLRSSMPVWGCTHRHQPMWNLTRLERTALDLLESGQLRVKPMIGPVLPFDQAAEAYALIDQGAETGVKAILTYGRQ